MTKSQPDKGNRLQRQVALIEKICAARGFSYQDLGERVGASRETIRKYAGGYQPASERLMSLIAKLLSVEPTLDASPSTAHEQAGAGSSNPPIAREATLSEKLLYVLDRGTPEEGALVRAFIESAYRSVSKRAAGQPEQP